MTENKKASDKLKAEIKDATRVRLCMYKRDFRLDLDSEAVIDMESDYIVALLERGLERLEKQ
jgi:hypothetical protein